jgi:hypothetical protein
VTADRLLGPDWRGGDAGRARTGVTLAGVLLLAALAAGFVLLWRRAHPA